jgi:hypothetical protein
LGSKESRWQIVELAAEATDRSLCDQQVTVGNDGLREQVLAYIGDRSTDWKGIIFDQQVREIRNDGLKEHVLAYKGGTISDARSASSVLAVKI